MAERFENWQAPDITHGVPTKYNWVVLRPEKFKMGKNVDIGAFALICAHEGVVLGDNVQIGGGVKIYSYNSMDDTKGSVIIQDGACIGANSVILPGVVIGKNSIIGAMSLVKQSIPDNVIAYGIPAQVIRKRQ